MTKSFNDLVVLAVATKKEKQNIHKNIFNTTNRSEPFHNTEDAPGVNDGISFNPEIHLSNNRVIISNFNFVRTEESDIIKFLFRYTHTWNIAIRF